MLLYTTLEKLQKYLWDETTENATKIEDLIETATTLLDTEIGQNLESKTFTRRIDGTGTCRIVMERSDITAVTSVRDVRTSSIATLDYIDWSVIYLTRDIDRGRKNIEIMYVAWFTEVPKDLEAYFLEYCKALWTVMHSSDTKVQKSKRIWDLSVTYFSPSELASESLARPEMDAILRKYKNFQIAITM